MGNGLRLAWSQFMAPAREQASWPPKLFALRQKLGQKAKQEPKFRFYSLSEHQPQRVENATTLEKIHPSLFA